MLLSGSKIQYPSNACYNAYSRSIPGFEDRIEFGVIVPMEDYKFLRAFNSTTLLSTALTGSTYLILDEDLGYEVSKSYMEDLDGNNIRNAFIGPSTSSGSKSIVQTRPGKQHISTSTRLEIDEDTQGVADTLRMDMTINDSIIIATHPVGWSESQLACNCTVRTPRMASISNHSNSVIYNLGSGYNTVISLPVTGKSTIDPRFSYRFSFYYRVNGDISVQPQISFYTNEGGETDTEISSVNYSITSLDANDDEYGDFKYFQIAIPRVSLKESIPINTKRIKVSIALVSVTGGKIEMIYPVLEHGYDLSPSQGFAFMQEPPSRFSYRENFSGALRKSPIGTIIPFDSAKLFYSHIGRKLFDIDMEFDIIDSSFLYQLRMLEWLNLMGYKIAFRPNHPDLPPVLKGDIRIMNNNQTYDYQVNDVGLHFEESE